MKDTKYAKIYCFYALMMSYKKEKLRKTIPFTNANKKNT